MTKELTFPPTRPDGLLRPPTFLSPSYVGSILRKVRHLPHYVQRLKTAGTFPPVPRTTTVTFIFTDPYVYLLFTTNMSTHENSCDLGSVGA